MNDNDDDDDGDVEDDVDNDFIRGKRFFFSDGTDIIDLVIGDRSYAGYGANCRAKDEIEIVFDYTMVEYNVSNKNDDEEDQFEDGNDKNTTAILIPAPQQR